jgi:hypothetical protein
MDRLGGTCPILLVGLGLLFFTPESARAQNAPEPPTDCETRVPGTPLPYTNGAAPSQVDISKYDTIQLKIIGHSENRGYHTFLQQMLDDNPIGGKKYIVKNNWIDGHEAFRWATPGERGYEAIERILRERVHPTIALVLTSNNARRPIQTPDPSDPHFVLFVENTESMADHLYSNGNGAMMIYFSSHRYKPTNLIPAYNEQFAVGALMASAEAAGKAYIKSGPEQHDLHWCCFPDCYAADRAHTNAEGDRLMAEAWYNLLSSELVLNLTADTVTSVSAASFSGSALAPASIAAAFGPNLATHTEAARTIPLPSSLAGTEVHITDSTGAQATTPLFFVSPSQLNYLSERGCSY